MYHLPRTTSVTFDERRLLSAQTRVIRDHGHLVSYYPVNSSTATGRTTTNAWRSCAVEASWVHNIATKVVFGNCAIAEGDFGVEQPNVGTRRYCTALKARNILVLRCARSVPDL